MVSVVSVPKTRRPSDLRVYLRGDRGTMDLLNRAVHPKSVGDHAATMPRDRMPTANYCSAQRYDQRR